jgi:hypothetical protein
MFASISRLLRPLVASLILLSALRLGAQDAGEVLLNGRVTARGSSSGIPDAVVAVEGVEGATRTDADGRYQLRRIPPGPRILTVRRIGYAPVRVPVVVPSSGTLTTDVVLATSALQLEQLTVTADRAGRARGELGTASVIDRDAIANQVTSSLQGVLELLPGVALQPPGLDAAAQFSLRALAATGGGAGDVGAAGTLIILDGVPLSNNANLQTVGSRGQVVPPASTAGGGIDLRRIPAATLERVEVIRGLPSVRWGDLTQGAIIVDTRAAATAPEFVARFDPRTSEGNVVGGRGWADERQAATATFNLARTSAARTLSNAVTTRGAAQLAHRLRLGEVPDGRLGPDGRTPLPRFSLDSRLDWWSLTYDSPERVDVEPGRNSFQDDWGLRLGERARWAMDRGQLEWTLSLDVQGQRTSESRRLVRPVQPFTDRLTEGRQVGIFTEGAYSGAYDLLGAPRLLYSRVEYEHTTLAEWGGLRVGQWRAGAELRREWNDGAGYRFDIQSPPQVSAFTGFNGFDRPRRFDVVPPLVSSAAYTDVRLTGQLLRMPFDVQPGLRLDLLHEGSTWLSGTRSAVLQPRITAELSPRDWVRVRGGVGRVGKLPTIGQLYPYPQYFDVVNVNRYTPAPEERLAVLTTFIRDPANPSLGMSRGDKRELSLDLDGGAKFGALSVTWFDDAVTGAVTTRRDPVVLTRDRFALTDTATGSGQPGRIVEPPIVSDPVPVFLDRFVNGGRLRTRGTEVIASLPTIPALRTRLEITGAQLTTTFATDDRDFGNISATNDFQIDSTRRRLAFFEGRSNRARQAIITYRLVHHQPDLGLVITGTVQQRRGFERRVLGRTDSLSFEGYLTRTGELVRVPEADRLLPEYADLRRARAGQAALTNRQPDDWLISLQVVKSVGRDGRLSFYVFNALDKLATFGGGGAVRALPSSRFGAELTLPLGGLLGGAR